MILYKSYNPITISKCNFGFKTKSTDSSKSLVFVRLQNLVYVSWDMYLYGSTKVFIDTTNEQKNTWSDSPIRQKLSLWFYITSGTIFDTTCEIFGTELKLNVIGSCTLIIVVERKKIGYFLDSELPK